MLTPLPSLALSLSPLLKILPSTSRNGYASSPFSTRQSKIKLPNHLLDFFSEKYYYWYSGLID